MLPFWAHLRFLKTGVRRGDLHQTEECCRAVALRARQFREGPQPSGPRAPFLFPARFRWKAGLLQNLVERAAILSRNGVLANPLPVLVSERVVANSTVSDPISLQGAPGTFMDSQREIIFQALHGAEWVIGGPQGAAARLGLKRTTLIAKMRKLGISRPPRRSETVGLTGR